MSNTEQKKNNRLIFLSILGIPVTIVLAATWLWYFVARGDIDLVGMLGTANYGQLVQPPRQLGDARLLTGEGEELNWDDLPRQWTFLVPGTDHCASQCEEVLYLTRQIRLAMGKELHRLRRFYVGTVPPAETGLEVGALSDGHPVPEGFGQYMAREHEGMAVFTVAADGWARLFPERLADPSRWYLVDPAGWIMMSYNSEVTYKQVMADLKFLLKNSSE